jgi:hypothetical protein
MYKKQAHLSSVVDPDPDADQLGSAGHADPDRYQFPSK